MLGQYINLVPSHTASTTQPSPTTQTSPTTQPSNPTTQPTGISSSVQNYWQLSIYHCMWYSDSAQLS